MKTRIAFLAIAAGLAVSPASAQESGGSSSGSIAAAAPRPPRELAELSYWVGKWNCTGQVFASPLGPAYRVVDIHSFEPVLDGFWFMRHEEDAKTADNPSPNKDIEFEGYDPATRKFVAIGYDNSGGSWSDSADNAWGPFLGTYTLNGARFGIRYTPARRSESKWSAVSEVQLDGRWRKTEAITCGRQ